VPRCWLAACVSRVSLRSFRRSDRAGQTGPRRASARPRVLSLACRRVAPRDLTARECTSPAISREPGCAEMSSAPTCAEPPGCNPDELAEAAFQGSARSGTCRNVSNANESQAAGYRFGVRIPRQNASERDETRQFAKVPNPW
jgi:hypothetical protein